MKKIKKGDEVIVRTGKDKGRKGTVLQVIADGKKLLVEGINTAKKHAKPNPNKNDNGGIIIKTMPIDRSNVMVYNPTTEKGSRIGIRILEDGKRVRYFKDNNEQVEA